MVEPATNLAVSVPDGDRLPAALHDEITARVAGGDLEIPMLPQVASEILAKGGGENVDVRLLSDLLHRDQALAGHVLRIANSAAFGGDVRIQSIQQALIRIGLVQMREIVVTITVHGKVFRTDSHKDLVAELWRHSTLAGLYAKEIARHRRANVESAFVCGLLHDVGKPVVLGVLLDVCKARRHTPTPGACMVTLDELHTQVGRLLAERWALPESVLEAIARHHEAETGASLTPEVQMTALADLLAYTVAKDDDACQADRILFEGHPLCGALNLYPDDVDALFAHRATILQQAQTFAS
jgi:putative nucleotidyltransferase with HDIG domain